MNFAQQASAKSNHFHLPRIEFDKTVLILTGWAGAGKSKTFELLLSGLSEQLDKVGAIVNEVSMQSALVDLARFPAQAKAKAVAGCACCVSIEQIVDKVQEFSRHGAKLTIIEQSPLSRTDRIVRRLRSIGYNTFVVALISPYQLRETKSYSYLQIRCADGIILSHLGAPEEADSQPRREAEVLVGELTKDLGKKPTVVLSSGERDFATLVKFWPIIESTRNNGTTTKLHNTESEKQRQQDVANYSEIYIHPYSNLSNESIAKALSTLRTDARQVGVSEPIKVIRAKGVIAAENIDVSVDERGFHVTRSARNPEAPRTDGRDYLLVRALDSRLFQCHGHLYQHLGTHECGAKTVEAITALYPSREQILRSLDGEELQVVMSADTLLWDLVDSLALLGRIPDQERLHEVGDAVISLLSAFLDFRRMLHQALATRDPVKQAQVLFDAAFVTCKILAHPHLQPLLTSEGSPLFSLSREVKLTAPISQLLQGLAHVRSLSINGRGRLSAEDVDWFKLIFAAPWLERGSKQLTQPALANIERLSSSDPTYSWKTYFRDLKEALIR